MQTLLKNELKRMFLEKEFIITLLIGCGISIWHFYQYVYKMQLFELDVPDNLYVCWMGAGAYHMQSYWYYMIFPLLAVLPYVGSYFDDLRTGYVKSVLLRCNRKAYFGVKGIVTFLSGGISVTIPLLLNLILTATMRPALKPDPFVAIGPMTYCMGSEFYYTHPLLYTVLYLLFDFIAGGMIAVGAMLLCSRVNYKFLAFIIPYGIFYFLQCMGTIFDTNDFSPNAFLIPGVGIKGIGSIIMVAAYIGIVLIVYIRKGKKYEA